MILVELFDIEGIGDIHAGWKFSVIGIVLDPL